MSNHTDWYRPWSRDLQEGFASARFSACICCLFFDFHYARLADMSMFDGKVCINVGGRNKYTNSNGTYFIIEQ